MNSKVRLIVIVLVLALVIFGAVSLLGGKNDGPTASDIKAADELEYEVYSREELGITFSHPKNYDFQVVYTPEMPMTIEGVKEIRPHMFSAVMNGEDGVFALVVNSTDVGFEGIGEPKEGDRTIGGIRAQRQELVDEKAGQKVVMYQFMNGDDAYVWIGQFSNKNTKGEAVFNKMLDSVSFN